MKSLAARVSRLEEAAGKGRDPLFIVIALIGAHEGKPIPEQVMGYSWGQGRQALRRKGESAEALLDRAEREAMPDIEPWGGIVFNEMRA